MNRRAAVVLEVLAVVAVLALSGWLRLRELDRHLVADELRWVCRSVTFHEALTERDWLRTFQVGHPGVVTMWLGTLALPLDQTGRWLELCPLTDGGRDLSKLDDVGREGLLQTIAPLLYQARRGIALGSLAVLTLLYLLLRLGARLAAAPALAGWGLVALDPYLLAHSRVLHLDAMLALLTLSAVVALSLAERPGRRGKVGAAGAGVLAGLAMLAKSAAFLLGPFAAAWFAWRAWRAGAWRPALAAFVAWGLAAALVYYIAWPSMWTDPLGTVTGVLTKAQEEGASPHESGNYFLGQPVDDPGPAFYPVAGAYRLTPWVLVGLVVAVGWLFAARSSPQPPAPSPNAGGGGGVDGARALVGRALAWALFFGLVMTLGPKKFDRYLLPSLVAIDLAVGVALVSAAHHLPIPRPSRTRPDTPAPSIGGGGGGLGALALILLQAASAARAMPYPMAYYNPLLGGATAAARVLLVGWGEGYDQAARWLNGQPGAVGLEASARSVTVFGPQFAGRTRSAEGYRPGRTDYVVLYQNQVQRRQNEDVVAAYYDDPAAQPAFVGRIGGLDYVWVYPNRSVAAVRAALAARVAPGDVVLADGEGVLARTWAGAVPLVKFWGHWGEAEMREALARDFPPDWRRAWVVRYPGQDPDAARAVLGTVAAVGETVTLADGAVDLTLFTRSP